jgi:putative mycofactocin binding protein MftB
MNLDSVYRLREGVQVRNEVFGLLFYDYRGPRLYFVPSQNLINDAFFEGRQQVKDLLEHLCNENAWPRQQVQKQLGHVLQILERKGLIYGKPIC